MTLNQLLQLFFINTTFDILRTFYKCLSFYSQNQCHIFPFKIIQRTTYALYWHDGIITKQLSNTGQIRKSTSKPSIISRIVLMTSWESNTLSRMVLMMSSMRAMVNANLYSNASNISFTCHNQLGFVCYLNKTKEW